MLCSKNQAVQDIPPAWFHKKTRYFRPMLRHGYSGWPERGFPDDLQGLHPSPNRPDVVHPYLFDLAITITDLFLPVNSMTHSLNYNHVGIISRIIEWCAIKYDLIMSIKIFFLPTWSEFKQTNGY